MAESQENASKQATLRGGLSPDIGKDTQFKPGESGNPGGRPKITDEDRVITKIYRKILAKPENQAAIEEAVLKMLTGGRMVAQLTLKEMAERTEGKITQGVEGDMNVNFTLGEGMRIAMEKAEKRVRSSK
jgi:Family of unknown function (DUF5681)